VTACALSAFQRKL